jgi:RND family efflux transporter MFP subunit
MPQLPTMLRRLPRVRTLAGVPFVALVLLAPVTSHGQTLQGFTEPYETVLVAAPEPGIIDSIAVREGDPVAEGQVIASLDSQVLQASLATAKARAEAHGKLAAAEAASDLQQRRVRKFQSLRQQGHASPEELEQAETELAIAEANLVAAREELRLHELEAHRIRVGIERRVIRSPLDGVVLHIHKNVGESVAAGDTQVATVVQLTALRVTLYLPTEQARHLSPGGTIPLKTADGAVAAGQIEFVSPVTDSESGTVRVVAVIDNAQGRYRSGVRCELAAGSEIPSSED